MDIWLFFVNLGNYSKSTLITIVNLPEVLKSIKACDGNRTINQQVNLIKFFQPNKFD